MKIQLPARSIDVDEIRDAKARLKERFCNATEEFSSESCVSVSTPTCVPSRMLLSESLCENSKTLGDIPLVPLDCSNGKVTERTPVPLKKALKREARNAGSEKAAITLVFVVRRPGCASCREHGLQLAEMSLEFRNLALWAIVKQTDVEEESILSLVKEYFAFPVYKDQECNTYKAMGDRKLAPFKLMKRSMAAKRRWADKGIPNRAKGGDPWVQGGILMFKQGKLRYAYEEEYGKELEAADIRAAIKSLQEEEDTIGLERSLEGSSGFCSIRSDN